MSAEAALRAAVARLRAAGVEDAGRDARLLLARAMGIAPDRLLMHLKDPLAEPAFRVLDDLVAARVARQPMAQILGERLFWGRAFRVTRDTLDPRPDTETLIAAALEAPFTRLLDLGTGTGCIAVTLLAERPAARGMATDLSAAALAVAAENAARHGVADRLDLAQGPWWQPVADRDLDRGGEGGADGGPDGGADGGADRFDLIVSNPPYIAAEEMPGLAPEVRDWEPALALTPGGDGLDAYRAILAGISAHLAPGGRVLFEIGASQGPAVLALMRAAGLENPLLRPDLEGRDRVVLARAPR